MTQMNASISKANSSKGCSKPDLLFECNYGNLADIRTASVFSLPNLQDSLRHAEDTPRLFEVPIRQIYQQLGYFLGTPASELGWQAGVFVWCNYRDL
jgi:hypothetical protein